MSTEFKTAVIDPQVMADLEEAARYAASGLRDPEVMRQACEHMDLLSQEIRQKFGVQDIGVEIIREMRDSAA